MKRELPPNPADIHGPNAGEPGYDAIKKEINDSGEDLYIGTREEIDRAKAKVEAEGRAPDLVSALRMHKEVPIMAAALEELLAERHPDLFRTFKDLPKGAAEFAGADAGVNTVYYKDVAGNLAKVVIDVNKIDEFDPSKGGQRKSFFHEMTHLGFVPNSTKFFGEYSSAEIINFYLDGERKKQLEKSRREFSF